MIRTENLGKVFHNWSYLKKTTLVALQDVSLEIKESQVFGLLGLNGAGKTSLMKILLGLSFPTSGSAWVLDKPAGDLSARKRIGYLPEMPYFSRLFTPVEILDYYSRLFELEPSLMKKRIEDALKITGLYERRNSRLKEFSKGMLQRVGMAQLLLNDPDVLFLDEPTYGLDPLAAKEMRDIVLSLKSAGKTIFLNSHQISEVEKICDRIGILHRGRLIMSGPVKLPLEDYFVKTVRAAEAERK
jgi:ABC-2 type transport system ATP-binding protein